MTPLDIEGITKSFGTTQVLHGVDLHAPEGELTAILGPSGCGKTTLLRLIAGFDEPDAGTISIGSTMVAGPRGVVPPQRRRVGYVPQEGALFPHVNAAANITFGLPLRQRRGRHRVEELLELVGLAPEVGKRFPHQLSGGQQQRVALARALAPSPSLVLLDEPFSSLDAGLRNQTRRAVARALRESGSTAVLVTHDQDEALSMATQVAVMRGGRLVQVDSPEGIYTRPHDVAVGRFVGDAIALRAKIVSGVAECPLGRIPVAGDVPDHPARDILIRPVQVKLHSANSANAVRAEVIEVAYYGHDADVRLRLTDSDHVVHALTPGHDVPAVRSIVYAAVDGEALVFPSE
ncbi:iron(III) transport system ATP-binding protein [Antricoccus suffuscus]|uniref:ABC-type quaternary amine transporter n=1 Tax=Antricoccus suffuscus TaxID=1629062 RepID=A0A2T0ZB53_9ACTN|nr:ABC transporter ATP-binding protein [Antricoccus suffuscus]PRZ33577.1 iron(III) transport system ATP-binding protein [Antricoccus suffuscus]